MTGLALLWVFGAGTLVSAPSDTLKVEHDAVVISTTRSTRTIEDSPTRVEVIAGEELVEKGNMRPGDIRMLLNEMTGITIRQESSFLGESGIRMQGLDRRFTQVLKDGFPLYDGLSGGLGLLQTPPLDLAQVEIVKGPASTLYGARAVAGLVNLVSRRPGDEPELRLLLNGTTAGGTDASALMLRPGRFFSSSTYIQGGWQRLYDPSDAGFAAIPKSSKLYLRQSLFATPSASTDIQITGTYSNDDRTGGAMDAAGYRIRAESELKAVQAVMSHELGDWTLRSRSSVSRYDRHQSDTRFDGPRDHQTNRFSEWTASTTHETSEWVLGAAVQDVDYAQSPEGSTTVSVFGNWIRSLGKGVMLEAGYRLDHVDPYGTQHLPRVSLMVSPSLNQTYRITGGMGYVLPTLYLDSYRRPVDFLRPEHIRSVKPEQSLGGTADANFRSEWANLNVMGFWTQVNNGLSSELVGFLEGGGIGIGTMVMNHDPILVRGIETNLKLDKEPLALYLGHTFTDTDAELVSRHRFNSVLMIEEEDAWRIGLEAYYHGQQNIGKPYVIAGIMADYRIGFATVFINLENAFDVRQTRFERVYTSHASTTVPFADMAPLYAPLDGRILNGGLRFEF